MKPLLSDLERRFSEDPQWLNEFLSPEGRSLPDQPDWHPHVDQDQCGALEVQTECFVPFVSLRRS